MMENTEDEQGASKVWLFLCQFLGILNI